MLLNWFCLLVLVNFHNSDGLALPAQKFSPGIPITPTVNQTPGGVRGVLEDSSTGSIKESAPTNIHSAAPSTTVIHTQPNINSVIVHHSHQGHPLFPESNNPFYSSHQYGGLYPHRVHVHPDGVIVPGPPHPLHPAVRHAAVCACLRSNIYGNRFRPNNVGPGPLFF
ncbi:uncharacterized protein LOC109407406 [Aedes albopictus]|uniref:Uncharacterized protein n=1 Tax=Aedes albopictus TaxID=7160 RepID=A0ABM2A1D4_AEDAL